MTPESLAARLLQTFLAELDDQLGVLDAELVALERHPEEDGDRLASIFRVFHTLKGAARVAGAPRVAAVCHALETLLADVRAGRRALGAEEFALLFRAVDALGDAGRRLREQRPLDDAPLVELERQLGVRFVEPFSGAPPAAAADAVESAPPAATAEPARAWGGSAQPPAESGVATAPAEDAHELVGAEGGAEADAARPASAPAQAPTSVRVEAEKLDALVNATGDLLVSAARAESHPEALQGVTDEMGRWAREWRRLLPRLRAALDGGAAAEQLAALEARTRGVELALARATASARDDARALVRVSDEVAERVRRLRLRPFAEAAEALPRVARDVAAADGKEVELRVVGSEVEADRTVLDGVREALLHLVRNAVDHGLETPAERERAGKPPQGTVHVGAALRSGHLVVTVADDGRGLDTAAVREQLERRGQPAPADARELARVLFEGGFSTKRRATEISGRGVGLDVVRSAMRRIRGRVDVRWTAGEGTTFTLEAPVSLATQRALVVRVGELPLAVPTDAVERLVRLPATDLRLAEGRRFLSTPDGPVPVATLARLLGPPLADRALEGTVVLVQLLASGRRIALAVDGLESEGELVVRPISRRGGGALPALAGAALLGDGRVTLVLDAGAVMSAGLGSGAAGAVAVAAPPADLRRPCVLVVDDSITTRTLEQSVLEAAGYDVMTAVDGADGWRLLQERGADLVISDVEMPRMDGFTLCETVRASKRFAQLPVVLVTSLESPEHRARGLEAGADAYVVKSSFDQEALLATVRELLGRGGP